jgi:hypothetical protein
MNWNRLASGRIRVSSYRIQGGAEPTDTFKGPLLPYEGGKGEVLHTGKVIRSDHLQICPVAHGRWDM